jgi:hypothetical protein
LALTFATTTTPLIGVLSLLCADQPHNCPTSTGVSDATSYIPASYVKWLEGGGARVVPLRVDQNFGAVRQLLSQLNGVLFTGGTGNFASNSPYWTQVENVLGYLRQFQASTKKAIPLWSTCLGFQAVTCATAKEGDNALVPAPALDIPLTIQFTSYGPQSRIFNSTMDKAYAQQVYQTVATLPVTHNDHNSGFRPQTYANDAYLKTNFSVIGLSNDDTNTPFVTLMESLAATGLYWYGSQFHPEKPQYEFDTGDGENIPHNLNAIFANQYFAEFFVNEARLRNDNVMNQNTYLANVIYNWPAYFIDQEENVSYDQVYLFTNPN